MKETKNIVDQFKNAAEKSEQHLHPVNESIWDKIETKLDTQVLIKKNQIWKRIAIAASFLFFISILVVFLQDSNPKSKIENSIVTSDSISNQPKSEIAVQELDSDENIEPISTNKIIRPNAIVILKNSIKKDSAIVVADVESIGEKGYFDDVQNEVLTKKETRFAVPKYEARGVTSAPIQAEITTDKLQKAKVEPPLLIVNSKAITGASGKKYQNLTDDKLNAIGNENLEEVVYLKEPLYVIDGKQYTEEEMYGENPTSPYAPLSNQEIINTIVLRGKDATKAFGKKGEKGVLIITTKFGKPKPKPLLKSK